MRTTFQNLSKKIRANVLRIVMICLCCMPMGALIHAQPCEVAGGALSVFEPTTNLCLNDGSNKSIQFSVLGNVGIGRFGLVQAGSGVIVSSNQDGLFEMTNYPPGNYIAGHISVANLSTLAGISNLNQLSGCYDISNSIAVTTFWVDGGSISTQSATPINGGSIEFEVANATGPNFRWALLNQQASTILEINTNGIFNFDSYPAGTYRVAHAAFGAGIDLNSLNPQNLQGCIDASNLLTIVKEDGPPVPGPGEVLNPTTGRIWMDRNLGAERVATSLNDNLAFGYLYQWGRGTDGHQIRNSPTTTTISTSAQPPHGDFIRGSGSQLDWLSPSNDNLWQGVNGINNPCPEGLRLPTEAEWNAERLTWSSNGRFGAYNSTLKLTAAGVRSFNFGSITSNYMAYWSSTIFGSDAAIYVDITASSVELITFARAFGCSVRCIKD